MSASTDGGNVRFIRHHARVAITEARGLAITDIRCPACRGVRTVDPRQARRWREGHIPGTCASCRGGTASRKARERDIGYWLRLHGAEIPRGVKPRDYITASGAPPSLLEFAKDCFPLG